MLLCNKSLFGAIEFLLSVISSRAAVLRGHPVVSADSTRDCLGAVEDAIRPHRARNENSGKFLV
jgi:hypothetical protein